MQINFPNFGKSDCILIRIEDKIIMIDTSFTDNGPTICDMLLQNNISQIDYLILTHLDKDHIGGAPEILRNLSVKSIIQPDYKVHTPQYEAYKSTLLELGKIPVFLRNNITLSIGDAIVRLLAPEKAKYEKSNDYSIITEIFHGTSSFLFMGDAENIRINEFIKNNKRTYDLVKMPHHGILVPSTKDLIESTMPINAIITCAHVQTNIDRTIDLLDENQVNTYLTKKGPVIVLSDLDELNILQLIQSEI